MADIDPATFEVVKNALYAAAEEMKVVLAKTSRARWSRRVPTCPFTWAPCRSP